MAAGDLVAAAPLGLAAFAFCFAVVLNSKGSRLTRLSLFSLTFFSALLLHPVVARPRLKERLVLPSRLMSLGPLWVVVTLPAGVYLYLLDRQYLSLPRTNFLPATTKAPILNPYHFYYIGSTEYSDSAAGKGRGVGGVESGRTSGVFLLLYFFCQREVRCNGCLQRRREGGLDGAQALASLHTRRRSVGRS